MIFLSHFYQFTNFTLLDFKKKLDVNDKLM